MAEGSIPQRGRGSVASISPASVLTTTQTYGSLNPDEAARPARAGRSPLLLGHAVRRGFAVLCAAAALIGFNGTLVLAAAPPNDRFANATVIGDVPFE